MQKNISSILCVHQGYELYGSDRSFILSVSILKEMYPSAKITVIIPKDGPIRELLAKICDELIINEHLGILRKKELKKNPFKLLVKIIQGVFSALSQSKPYDLVYVNTIVVLDYILAARFMRCPTVLHVREIPTGLQRIIFSKILSFSKMNLIFNSFNTSQAFDSLENKNISVLLNGVEGFTHIPAKANGMTTTHILLIGRLTQWKGQMFFLQALSRLFEYKKYNIKVHIVGEVFEDQTTYKNELQTYVKDHNLENIVTFKPFTDNPKDEYEWSDIVIIPSIKPEPFGRVAIEAMSASRCVVAANHGGLTEIVQDKMNGILFEPNNINNLADMLHQLIASPDLIQKYSQQGLITFQNQFSDTIYQNTFKKVLRDISFE